MQSRLADRFLSRFRAATRRGSPLEELVADVPGFAAALESSPDELATAMAEAGDSAGGAASVPASAFVSAACDSHGKTLAADAGFAALGIAAQALAAAVRDAGSGAPRLSAIADDARGNPVALAVARSARAHAWPLGDAVRKALCADGTAFAVLAVRSANSTTWPGVFNAWKLTPAEARIADALIRTGDLRQAAVRACVSYETARESIATAMTKTGARRQPEFVRQLASLALGDLSSHDATWRTFADAYGLTASQGRIAHLIALGSTRTAASAALELSEHRVKAELKLVFERCGIAKGAALGRIVAEIDALACLATATDIQIDAAGREPAPLRFVRRRRVSGRICVADHGPAGAAPVVVFHTPLSGRHLPQVLVRALQAKGMRPIAVERPGFGLTSSADGDVFEEAAADLIDVLDALELERVRLLGRSCIMALMFAAEHPERVERGVLLSPNPPGYRPPRGFSAAVASLALDRPNLIAGFVRMLSRLSSDRSVIALAEAAVGGCATDMSALADPVNRSDFIRASRQSAAADGFAREFVVHADGGRMPAAAVATNWTVVRGALDTLGEARDGAAAWRAVLPNARVETIIDGGRFLHLSHAGAIAEALAAAW